MVRIWLAWEETRNSEMVLGGSSERKTEWMLARVWDRLIGNKGK